MSLDNAQTLIWHPFTQMKTAPRPLTIEKAQGAELISGSRSYLDLISSWWVTTHGHCHPKISRAIAEQAQKLDHVIFSGFTHEPALACAERLAKKLAPELRKIFFCDNGSCAVEIALKMAYQYHFNHNNGHRKRFITFKGNYHGDTFGSMSVGHSSDFHRPFEPLLFPTDTMPCPHTWEGDADVEAKEASCLEVIKQHLHNWGHETAAVIFEPILQGSYGMRYCRPEYLAKVVDLCREHGLLIIFDEVMTGFGRLGSFFGYEKIGRIPDLLCLAKGLSGGFLPLAMTIATQEIYEAFLDDTVDKAFIHGHSFTANPIGCAAACASLDLFEEEETLAKIRQIETWHREFTAQASILPHLGRPRIVGSIAAFEVPWGHKAYGSTFSLDVRQACLERGLVVRPLGSVMYLMPPYCITREQLEEAYNKIAEALSEVYAKSQGYSLAMNQDEGLSPQELLSWEQDAKRSVA